MRSLFVIVSLLACSSIVAAAPTAKKTKAPVSRSTARPAVYYDFKGARLGMSLAEWRAMPIIAQNPLASMPLSSIRMGEVRAICAGDPGVDSSTMSYRSSAEAKANVLICGYVFPETIGSSTMWMPASIPIGELSASGVEYKFMDGRLYEISITGNAGLLGEVMSGLQAKWGNPTTIISDTTQNKAGATFPHTVKTWVNSVAIIRLETPFSRIDDLNVSYSTADGLEKIEAIEKAANPDINKM